MATNATADSSDASMLISSTSRNRVSSCMSPPPDQRRVAHDIGRRRVRFFGDRHMARDAIGVALQLDGIAIDMRLAALGELRVGDAVFESRALACAFVGLVGLFEQLHVHSPGFGLIRHGLPVRRRLPAVSTYTVHKIHKAMSIATHASSIAIVLVIGPLRVLI